MRRLEVADLSLATLDALDVDALAVLVGPERPLQGGLYQGAPGEALLLPTAGRLPAGRVVAMGLPAPNRPEAFAVAARRLCEVLAKAGIASFAVALPPIEGADAAAAARLWLEAGGGPGAPVARQVVLGDARALLADFGAARTATGAAVELATFAARPAAMVR
jgi:hypothetical protein